MARVADIPRPEMPDADRLAQLATLQRHRTQYGRNKGAPNAAQQELTQMADAMLRGQSPHLRGNYSLADKYADRPSFAPRPYKTSVRYASGKAGRRAIRP